MGQLQERRRKDGKPSFTAQVRRKKGGKTIFGITETFDKRSPAKAWMERKERELSQPGGLKAAPPAKRSRTLGNVVAAHIEAQNGPIGRSKLQNLTATARFDLASRDADTLTADDFVQFARDLLKGPPPAPIDPPNAPADYANPKPRRPRTVAGYMTHLGAVIRHAGPLVRLKPPRAELQEAMDTCRHLDIIGKSAKRDRRPTLEELDKLMECFVEACENDPRALPMLDDIARIYGVEN